MLERTIAVEDPRLADLLKPRVPPHDGAAIKVLCHDGVLDAGEARELDARIPGVVVGRTKGQADDAGAGFTDAAVLGQAVDVADGNVRAGPGDGRRHDDGDYSQERDATTCPHGAFLPPALCGPVSRVRARVCVPESAARILLYRKLHRRRDGPEHEREGPARIASRTSGQTGQNQVGHAGDRNAE